MTAHGDIPMTVQAMKAGAVEFLAKPFRDQEMIDAVQLALEKDRTRRQRDYAQADLRDKFASLTERERQVMEFVAAGLMNKQVAGKMGLAEITVKIHRGNAVKMGAKSLADLVKMAQILGVTSEKS
jgi:FixJ family two-component response regulator